MGKSSVVARWSLRRSALYGLSYAVFVAWMNAMRDSFDMVTASSTLIGGVLLFPVIAAIRNRLVGAKKASM
ncbi:hypothetical protein [Mesorhizobium sp. 1B3]|uniref:hypothetical protein n=1 Tax=Mesorhizobium sp. 1B3 TaxID=3243599 RepID=UPI003D98D694